MHFQYREISQPLELVPANVMKHQNSESKHTPFSAESFWKTESQSEKALEEFASSHYVTKYFWTLKKVNHMWHCPAVDAICGCPIRSRFSPNGSCLL